MTKARPPDVDLVISFRATKTTSISKKTREDARKANEQYTRLIGALLSAGFKAVGRRGESLGHILLFVLCPHDLVEELVRRERHSDFLSGLPIPPSTPTLIIPPADRIRIIHSYISSTVAEGGLGISPNAPTWDCVESIFPLHDRRFNELWTRTWRKPRSIASVQLEKIRRQFGDAVAYYFAFLSTYTLFLTVPAFLGIIAHFFLPPYSPIYSISLCIWSIVFVEWWRVRERRLGLLFGTGGSFKVEKRRPQYQDGMSWWVRELRILASVPIVLVWAAVLSAIITAIFVFEAFITKLYKGPGKHIVAFSPTILFVILIPKFLAAYHSIAVRLTNWENHALKSTYNASLTLKTFALGAIVAYLALSLSAFVYVPFGEDVMLWVQAVLFGGGGGGDATGLGSLLREILNGTLSTSKFQLGVGAAAAVVAAGAAATTATTANSEKINTSTSDSGLWDISASNVRTKLNPSRLREQMFAYTVTNQVVDLFREVGLPFVIRWLNGRVNGKKGHGHNGHHQHASNSTSKGTAASTSGHQQASGSSSAVGLFITATEVTPRKRVVFEDEKERGGIEERVFLDKVRDEAALPEYDLFVDYNEMIVQFGYVVLWSSVWPLAGAVSLVNNLLELRSDAFKMSVHHRRPVPMRTDTIGPWLDALTFLTWLGALMNAALVYLFSPGSGATSASSGYADSATKQVVKESIYAAVTATTTTSAPAAATLKETRHLLLKAALVALLASHAFILVRLVVGHIFDRAFWMCSSELEEREREMREVRLSEFIGGLGEARLFFKRIEVEKIIIERELGVEDDDDEEQEVSVIRDEMGFWEKDEGGEEILRILKEA